MLSFGRRVAAQRAPAREGGRGRCGDHSSYTSARRGGHTSPDGRGLGRLDGVDRCADHEESSASPSMKACTAIWRAVSRSTATMAPPQWGHGGKATGVVVSPAEAGGAGGGLASSARRQRGNASVRQRGARKP